jgi:hypothetical protein
MGTETAQTDTPEKIRQLITGGITPAELERAMNTKNGQQALADEYGISTGTLRILAERWGIERPTKRRTKAKAETTTVEAAIA